MNFSGQYLFLTDRQHVWRSLNNVDMLKAAIPGCEHIDWVDRGRLDVAIKVNLGVMNPTFAGDLLLSDIVEARTYTLSGQGRGRLLGLAKGTSRIELDDHTRGTSMVMSATGEASSAIMALGQKLVGRTAQGVIDRFFERFANAMRVEMEILPADDTNTPADQ